MDPFIGQIMMFGFNFAPRGWAFCNGQLIPITQYTALFSLLGTQYGGDGRTTFGLPNMQSRIPMHQGQGGGLSPVTMGEMSGVENVTLLQNQMPMHNHLVNASSSASSKSPNGAVPAFSAGGSIYGTTPDQNMNPQMVGLAGGNQPFSIRNPYLVVNFCIALEGIFPSRN